MAISCSPDDLAYAARCLKCLDEGTLRKARARLLAVYAGGSTDPQVLAEAASQFRGLGQGTLQAIITMLMARTVYPVYYSGSSQGDGLVIPGDPALFDTWNYDITGAIEPGGNRISWTFPTPDTPGVGGFIPGLEVHSLTVQRGTIEDNRAEENAEGVHGSPFHATLSDWSDGGVHPPVHPTDPGWTNIQQWTYTHASGTVVADLETEYLDANSVSNPLEHTIYAYRITLIWYNNLFPTTNVYVLHWPTVIIFRPQAAPSVTRSGTTNTITWSAPAGSIP